MSQNQATYDAEIVAFKNLQEYNCVTVAVSALVFYEYFLTIAAEHKIVWRQKWTGMTWIFVMTRYAMVGSAISHLQSSSPCIVGEWLEQVVTIILPLLLATAFSALRVYAISGRSRLFTALVLALSLIPVSTNLWGLSRSTLGYVDDPIFGPSCTFTQTVSPSRMFTRVASVLADAIVLVVTWLNTFSQVRLASEVGIASLSTAFMRDGTIYFLALLGLNIGVLVLDASPSLVYKNIAVSVVTILPSVLICRFLMNLREASSPYNETTTESFSRFAPLKFRVPTMHDIVGNLGEGIYLERQSGYVEEFDDLDEVHEVGIISGESEGSGSNDSVQEICRGIAL